MNDTAAAVLVCFATMAALFTLRIVAQRLDNRRQHRAGAAPARGEWVRIEPEYTFIPGLAGKVGAVTDVDYSSLVVMVRIEERDMPYNALFDHNVVPFHVEDLRTLGGEKL